MFSLFVAYKKTYNLNTKTVTDICINTVHIIDELFYIMNDHLVYQGNIYNNISRRKFINEVLAEAFKDDSQTE